MDVTFAPGAWRTWCKLPPALQARLKAKLLAYASDPLRHAVKLTDASIGTYRFRIGDYRIVFDIVDDEIVILAVGHRKDIYR
jgi:mRNA interferase RelE/StbE